MCRDFDLAGRERERGFLSGLDFSWGFRSGYGLDLVGRERTKCEVSVMLEREREDEEKRMVMMLLS